MLLLPLPFLRDSSPGPLTEFSCSSSRSLMFTLERRMPIWTNTFPWASGRLLTVPFKFMESTRPPSPSFRVFGLMALCGFLVSCFKERPPSTFFKLSRSFVRSASRALVSMPEEVASLLMFLMVRSAVSFASRRICCASSLALRIILSLRSSKRSSFFSRPDFRRAISAL